MIPAVSVSGLRENLRDDDDDGAMTSHSRCSLVLIHSLARVVVYGRAVYRDGVITLAFMRARNIKAGH